MSHRNKPREKTATEAQGIRTVATNKLKCISIYIVTVGVAVTMFLHIFLKHPSSSLDGITELRNQNSTSIELIRDSIISISDYADKTQISELKEKLLILNTESERLDKIYSEKKEVARISGFPSAHKFFWHFGIGLVITSLSVYLLATVNMFDGHRKKAANFASMIGITISGYYMAWIFFPYDDLPYNIYMTILVLLGVLSAITAYWINKITFSTKQQLKGVIRYLMNLMVVKSIDLDLVRNIEVYTVEIVEPALNKLDEQVR